MAKQSSIALFESRFLSVVFVLLIVAPLIGAIVQEDEISSKLERRVFALLPAMPGSFEAMTGWPQDFDAYYSDHFGFRAKLNKFYFRLMAKLSSVEDGGAAVTTKDVTIGLDDWLFLGSNKVGYTGYGDPIGDALNLTLYTQSELKEFAEKSVALRDWLAERGVEYLIFIAPNKHTIYFEMLPGELTKYGPVSVTEQLVSYLRANTDLRVVYPRDALLAAKSDAQLYYKTDTHWNSLGANVAQYEMMRPLAQLFPEKVDARLLGPDEFEYRSNEFSELRGLVGLGGYLESDPTPVFDNACEPQKHVIREDSVLAHEEKRSVFLMTCETGQLNAVVFRDSFFSWLVPYTSRQFARSTYVWESMNNDSLEKYIELEQPDVLIYEFVERKLPLDAPSAPGIR